MSEDAVSDVAILRFLTGSPVTAAERELITELISDSDSQIWKVASRLSGSTTLGSLELAHQEGEKRRFFSRRSALTVAAAGIGCVWLAGQFLPEANAETPAALKQVSHELRLAVSLLQAGDLADAEAIQLSSLSRLQAFHPKSKYDKDEETKREVILYGCFGAAASDRSQQGLSEQHFDRAQQRLRAVRSDSEGVAAVYALLSAISDYRMGIRNVGPRERYLLNAQSTLNRIPDVAIKGWPLLGVRRTILQACIRHRLKDGEGSLALFRDARKRLAQLQDLDLHARLLSVLLLKNEGLTLNRLSRREAAISGYREALGFVEQLRNTQLSSVGPMLEGVVQNNIADTFYQEQKWASARDERTKAVNPLLQFLSSSNNQNARDNLRLAFVRLMIESAMLDDARGMTRWCFALHGSTRIVEYDLAQLSLHEKFALFLATYTLDVEADSQIVERLLESAIDVQMRLKDPKLQRVVEKVLASCKRSATENKQRTLRRVEMLLGNPA